jgi:hypothetical protein
MNQRAYWTIRKALADVLDQIDALRKCGLFTYDIAEMMEEGSSQSVADHRKLLRLSPKEQEKVRAGKLSFKAALRRANVHVQSI